MTYIYRSENFGGNLHEAVIEINARASITGNPIDVVTMYPVGGYTIVVTREPASADRLASHVRAVRARIEEGRIKR